MSDSYATHMDKVVSLFRYDHLPNHLQRASKPFYDLAITIVEELPPSAERTLSLRSLWEAKNLAVFAKVEATDKEIS